MTLRPGLDRGAAVDEQDAGPGALREEPHAGEDLVDGRDGAVDRELDRPLEVGRGGLEHGSHEVLLRQRAVLQHLDRPQPLGRLLEGGGDALRVAYVGGESLRLDAVLLQLRGERVEPALVP